MNKEPYEELSEAELERLEQVEVDFSKDSFKVAQGICPPCNKKMEKIVYTESLLDGTMTMHIIKFKCVACKKEYLDLEEAKKYDLLLQLRHASEEDISQALAAVRNGKVQAAEEV